MHASRPSRAGRRITKQRKKRTPRRHCHTISTIFLLYLCMIEVGTGLNQVGLNEEEEGKNYEKIRDCFDLHHHVPLRNVHPPRI